MRYVFLIAAIWACLIAGAAAISEHAAFTGYTDIYTRVPGASDGSEDNYGVFLKGRYVYIRDFVAPHEIRMHGGRLVRTDWVLMNTRIPVKTYTDASLAESALWHRYFN